MHNTFADTRVQSEFRSALESSYSSVLFQRLESLTAVKKVQVYNKATHAAVEMMSIGYNFEIVHDSVVEIVMKFMQTIN